MSKKQCGRELGGYTCTRKRGHKAACKDEINRGTWIPRPTTEVK